MEYFVVFTDRILWKFKRFPVISLRKFFCRPLGRTSLKLHCWNDFSFFSRSQAEMNSVLSARDSRADRKTFATTLRFDDEPRLNAFFPPGRAFECSTGTETGKRSLLPDGGKSGKKTAPVRIRLQKYFRLFFKGGFFPDQSWRSLDGWTPV